MDNPMKLSRHALSGLIILLGTAGLILSLAAGIGVWVVKEPVTTKTTRLFGRVENALNVVDSGLHEVKSILARAAERLETVKEEQRDSSREPNKKDMSRRLIARTIQERISPDFGDAHTSVGTVAEAAVVVNSVLDDIGNFPFLSETGLDLDRLGEIKKNISQVESSAWEMYRLLGEGNSDSAADTQLTRLEQILSVLRGLIAEYEPRLKEARRRVGELKSRTHSWIGFATVAISAICFWIALSQLSILSHAWSWWRRARKPVVL
jgi:hypothetical protein